MFGSKQFLQILKGTGRWRGTHTRCMVFVLRPCLAARAGRAGGRLSPKVTSRTRGHSRVQLPGTRLPPLLLGWPSTSLGSLLPPADSSPPPLPATAPSPGYQVTLHHETGDYTERGLCPGAQRARHPGTTGSAYVTGVK